MAARPRRQNRGLRTAVSLSILLLLALSSCSHRLGWGLVLWTSSDGPVPAGSVVPVYIKSNINQVYVVGSPEGKKKVELPLWQLELYGSKAKAKAAAAKFAPVASLYLVTMRDGLPVRESPANTADRVYRLHEGQSVKILAKAEGEVVKTGEAALSGDWYYVLTDDGTRGYVFSNTMRLFDELKETTSPALATKSSGSSSVKIDLLFQKSWRPEYFQAELDSGRIDLDLFSARFGLFSDAVHRQIRLELPTKSQVFQYSSIAEEGDSFVFEGTPLRVRFDGERRLIADWSGLDSAASAAKSASVAKALAPAAPGTPATPAAPTAPVTTGSQATQATQATATDSAEAAAAQPSNSAVFIVLSTDIRDSIRMEELRRQRLLDAFIAQGSDWSLLLQPRAAEPSAASSASDSPEAASVPAETSLVAQPSASRLGLSGKGRFSWARAELVPSGYLPPGLPSGSPLTGDAAFRLFLAPGLETQWQGALSLRFDASQASAWTDFLYRVDGEVLVLVPAAGVSGLEVSGADSLLPLRFSRMKTQ